MRPLMVWGIALVMLVPAFSAAEAPTDVNSPAFSQTSRAPLFWLRLRRWLTSDTVTDTKLTLALMNRLTQRLTTKPERRAELVEEYADERDRLAAFSQILLSDEDDTRISQLLDTILADETIQAVYLADLAAKESGQLAEKLIKIRQETILKITEVLAHDGFSPAEKQDKIAKLLQKYAERQEKVANKLMEELAYKDDLDDATDDVELEEALGNAEDDILDDAPNQLKDGELADFVDKISHREGEQAVVVLQKLLTRVPEAARSGIETAIDAVIREQIVAFRTDPSQVSAFLLDYSGSDTVRKLILERIKEQAGSEELKQAIEQLKEETDRAEEARKKELERAREARKRLNKDRDQSAVDEDERKDETNEDKEEPSASPSDPSTSSASPSNSYSELREETIEIKIREDGTLEKTTFSVENGTVLILRVESEYDSPVSMTVSGVGTKTITKDQRQTFGPFTITATVSFTVNNQSGSILVK